MALLSCAHCFYPVRLCGRQKPRRTALRCEDCPEARYRPSEFSLLGLLLLFCLEPGRESRGCLLTIRSCSVTPMVLAVMSYLLAQPQSQPFVFSLCDKTNKHI